VEPLNEYAFYEGYRKRLEIKLSQKNTQIMRDERLLDTLSEDEKIAMKKSMEQAVNEREEIHALLAQIRDRLETIPKPKES
jgi:hypothetical protein